MSKLKPNQFTLSGHLITERPLLFQKEMVQANLEDRKMQTRRGKGLEHVNDPEYQKSITFMRMDYDFDQNRVLRVFRNGDQFNSTIFKSPYGKPGDLLWVRETWAKVLDTDYYPFYAYKSDFPFSVDRWKPSIHMPKEAARLWLMVEDVRVERLQDINEQDAIAEGCSPYGPFGEFRGSPHPNGGAMKYRAYAKASYAFQCIWEEINGKESWKANPWVWVVQYRVLSKTGRPEEKTILHHFLNIVKGEKNYMTI